MALLEADPVKHLNDEPSSMPVELHIEQIT